MNQKGFAPVYVLILVFALVSAIYFVASKDGLMSKNDIVPGEYPTQSPDPTANWKEYPVDDWGVTIKAQNPPAKEGVLYAGSHMVYDRSKLYPCPSDVSSSVSNCLISKNWGQQEDIQPITLAGKSAVRFFVFEPKTNTISEVVQTTETPFGEISMKVDGAGLQKEFELILSTLRFIDRN